MRGFVGRLGPRVFKGGCFAGLDSAGIKVGNDIRGRDVIRQRASTIRLNIGMTYWEVDMLTLNG